MLGLKSFTSFFKKAPPKVIEITPQLIDRRLKLIANLEKVYKTQSDLLKKETDKKLNIPLVNHYLDLQKILKYEIEKLKNIKSNYNTIPETSLLQILNDELNKKTSELEEINSKISPADLIDLDSNYSDNVDEFFNKFHRNRISATFEIKEYLSEKPLLRHCKPVELIKSAIKTTERILSLNDYPVPKFKLVPTNEDLYVYCIPQHIIHIIFELLKNAAIPSLTNNKPITISVERDKTDSQYLLISIKDDGGGLDNKTMDKIWHFHYTTSSDKERDPIHGFGMGLPLCKVFTMFNDGELKLINNENEGVEILLKLPLDKGI